VDDRNVDLSCAASLRQNSSREAPRQWKEVNTFGCAVKAVIESREENHPKKTKAEEVGKQVD